MPGLEPLMLGTLPDTGTIVEPVPGRTMPGLEPEGEGRGEEGTTLTGYTLCAQGRRHGRGYMFPAG